MKVSTWILVLVSLYNLCAAQESSPMWSEMKAAQKSTNQERWIIPDKYRAVTLNKAALQKALKSSTPGKSNKETMLIDIPMPSGEIQQFAVSESSIMAPELAAKYQDIKTYKGRSITDPRATIYMDVTPKGFHAMILRPNGTVFIDPYYRNSDEHYVSYLKKDYSYGKVSSWSCHYHHAQEEPKKHDPSTEPTDQEIKLEKSNASIKMRTYRIAIATTGEYTAYHGGTVAGALAAINTTLNRVRGIYETELAVSFTLIADNDDIIYTNPSTDPYTNNDGGTMLGQNQTTIDNIIGSANYDVGHVFSTGGGGIAGLGVICNNNSKARGVTGSGAPVGDPFDVDFVAHELGHQFAGNHTWNGVGGSCSPGNNNPSTSYEPGSGSTIQAYAGICGAANIQSNSDDYFHLANLIEMRAHVTDGSGATCGNAGAISNTTPIANANAKRINHKSIPARTPFELTGSATDANNDNLTYNWEQWDLGPQGNINAASTTAPIFRSFEPTTSPTRIFPKLSSILNNTTSTGEVLPTVSRSLSFQLIARDDNTDASGYDADRITLSVVGSAGPFKINSPNTAGTYSGSTNVTWDVAGTDAAPINCGYVDILLSTDGGQTFTIPLANNVANDGSANIILPELNTSTARLKVKCSDNVFLDINDANFTIQPAGNPPSTCAITAITAGSQSSCEPATGEYSQLLTVTYSNPPSGSKLIVNGQIFDVTSSPQMIVLAGLTADGATVDVEASFDIEPGCTLSAPSLFTAPSSCFVPTCQTFTSTDIPKTITSNSTVSSNLTISGAKRIVDINVKNINATHTYFGDVGMNLYTPNGTQVSLFRPGGCNNSVTDRIWSMDSDATEPWVCPPASNVTYIPTDDLSFLSDLDPNGTWRLDVYDSFTGDEGTLNGWSIEICTQGDAPAATCDITSIMAGEQGACDPNTNTYSQSITVTYENPPLIGKLSVNGQKFDITGSPQVVTLTGLSADSEPVNVTAFFDEDPSCLTSSSSLFTAPAPCGVSDCDDYIVNQNPIANGTYHSNNELSSKGTIPAGNQVLFKAQNAVKLIHGFTIEKPGTLEISIENCDND